MNRRNSFYRTAFVCAAAVTLPLAACDTNDGPTQPSDFPVSVAPPTPPPPPPPVPADAPWLGFIGTEADGPVAMSGLPGMTESRPAAINDVGEVVGTVVYGGLRRAFIWSRADGMRDLGVLPGDTRSSASAINAKGQVVGHSWPDSGRSHAFRWTRETGMVDLGMPGGCVSPGPAGINNNGEIVGGNCSIALNGYVGRPFRWTEARGMEDIGIPPSAGYAVALAVNDRGEIVGYSGAGSYTSDATKALLWAGEGLKAVQIGSCPVSECYDMATAINSNGDVVGTVAFNAFLRTSEGTVHDLGRVTGAWYTVATGINDRREVVGVSYVSDPTSRVAALHWSEAGGMRELKMTGKNEIEMTGINNKGEFVGYSR